MWNYISRLVIHLFQRPAFPFLVALSLTLICGFSLFIYWAESSVNPMVQTLGDAAYLSVALLTTVGLGDVHPITPIGKIITAVMMLVGALLFVSFTGVISSSLHIVEEELKNKN